VAFSITVSDPQPRAGERVTVTGHGFDPTQRYQVSFVQDSSVPLSFPASPGAGGDFTTVVRIPFFADPGSATLEGCVYLVQGGQSSRCATAPVVIRD
jgi:hypothetical protein